MADTYTLISSVTVGAGGASSIDFTSIPATYTDLLVKVSARSSRSLAYDNLNITFNSNTSSYSSRRIYGTGSATGSDSDPAGTSSYYAALVDGNTSTSNTFANVEIYIPNAFGSNYKSISSDSVEEENASTAYVQLTAGLWSNSAAISSISLGCGHGNFVQYSTAYLYGIKNSQENKWQIQKSQLIAKLAKYQRQN